MTEQSKDWQAVAEEEKQLRINAEKSLAEMRHFLFDYFHLLGPDPRKNMSIVVDTLGKVLGTTVALYNRLESGVLKTWCIDNEPEGYQREDTPDGHICYDMTIRQHNPSNIKPVTLNNLEGTEWETLDSNVAEYGLKSYLGYPVLVEKDVVGSLCVVDVEKRNFTDVEMYIIEAFAGAIRLEEERLLTQNRLAAANDDLKRINAEIEALALTDQLTLLPNRRAMIADLETSIAMLQRSLHRPRENDQFKGFSIALCDVDYFKKFNDTYGHNFGDEVLVSVAQTLKSGLRATDEIARWGGEEFLILFRETNLENSAMVAERLRSAVENLELSFEGRPVKLTITLGVSACVSENVSVDRCINDADMALYEGKKQGRNCVVLSKSVD